MHFVVGSKILHSLWKWGGWGGGLLIVWFLQIERLRTHKGIFKLLANSVYSVEMFKKSLIRMSLVLWCFVKSLQFCFGSGFKR